MQSQQEFIQYSSPLRLDLGEYGRLIDRICEDIPNPPRIPHHVREGAKRIIKLVRTHYPTQGRRRIAIVITALGIARGNSNVNDLRDLLHRAKYFTGEEIPNGQVQNAFEDLHKFLELLPLYRSNRVYHFELTPEEKRVLGVLNGKTLTRERFSNREYASLP